MDRTGFAVGSNSLKGEVIMSKTTNKFSPEERRRAIRMVLNDEAEHASRWAAVLSIAAKIGCSPATLHEWGEEDRGRQRQTGRFAK